MFSANETKEKEGKWKECVNITENKIIGYYCSECRRFIKEKTNYCPNCRAKMIKNELTKEEAKVRIRSIFCDYFPFDGEKEADKVINALAGTQVNSNE